jgi:molecular chaperone DnaK
VVSFHPNGNVLVGEPAKERRLNDPANTVYSVKRLIGRSWQSDEVQQARGRFPFELKEGAKNSTLIVARGENYALPEISAFVLRRAKAVAEQALGETVDRAVITVPANFNDLQRASTKVAGKLAGLEVLRILNEPTAAALAYGQGSTAAERLAVYDLGGGTFDITLLDLSGNVFEVLATAGDTALGGDDIDLIIADLMAEQIVRTHRFDPRVDATEFARLRIYAELLKQQLSGQAEASTEIQDLATGEGGKSVTIHFKMTRDDLERETAPMIERTLEVCRFAIETVSLKVDAIDRVILVGGPTRMPLVAREVERFFKKPPALKVNPDEVVALGAAIQAHVLDRGRKKSTQAVTGPAQRSNVVQNAPPPPSSPAPAVPRISAQQPSQAPPLPKQATGRFVAPSIRAAQPAPAREGPRAEAKGRGDLFPTSGTDEDTAAFTRPLSASMPASPPAAPSFAAPPPPPEPAPVVPQRIVALGGLFPPAKEAPPPEMGGAPIGDLLDLPKPDASQGLSLPRSAPSLTFDDVPPPGPRPQVKPFAQFVPPQASYSPPAPPVTPSLTPHAEAFARGGSVRPQIAAPLLIDVTPLSLRVETVGGYCDVLIAANTSVPCDRTRVFLTAADGQTTVIVRVAQGESNKFAENTFLGELELSGITPAPRGETQIGVTFEIDADGILNVKARDVKSGRETHARLQLLGAQTEQKDVDEMMKRQQQHAVM